jgi:hypothetical protein
MSRWMICLAFVLVSCSQRGQPITERPAASGHYTSDGPQVDDLADFPHGSQPKSMTIDRDAGTIRIEYDRAGEHVTETWRIASSGSLIYE